ncbi:MAG TPA: hypothetical protein VKR53_08255 [Puia sp.]|nr:hypothetical protein [Puia sp.]
MSIQPKHNQLSKLLFGIAFLLTICIFSCNGSGSSTESKDSTTAAKDSTMSKDSTMKMKSDSTSKTDTSGKGGQQTPTGK